MAEKVMENLKNLTVDESSVYKRLLHQSVDFYACEMFLIHFFFLFKDLRKTSRRTSRNVLHNQSAALDSYLFCL